jgi:hypothetical protein
MWNRCEDCGVVLAEYEGVNAKNCRAWFDLFASTLECSNVDIIDLIATQVKLWCDLRGDLVKKFDH